MSVRRSKTYEEVVRAIEVEVERAREEEWAEERTIRVRAWVYRDAAVGERFRIEGRFYVLDEDPEGVPVLVREEEP